MTKVAQVLADMREERVSTAVLSLNYCPTQTIAMENDFMELCGYSEDEAAEATNNVYEYDLNH